MVAIVGILGTIAVPAYQDYLIRTRVAEGMLLASGAKALVIENAVNGLPLAAGWSGVSSKYVDSVSVEQVNGIVKVVYGEKLTGDGVKYTLWMVPKVGTAASALVGTLSGTATESTIPSGSVVTWSCRVSGTLGSDVGLRGSLPKKWAPSECHSLS